MVCAGCHVVRYCNQGHQRQAWKKGRLCHKEWRRVQKGKYSNDSCNAIFNGFLESIIVDLPVATRRPGAFEIEAYPFKREEDESNRQAYCHGFGMHTHYLYTK